VCVSVWERGRDEACELAGKVETSNKRIGIHVITLTSLSFGGTTRNFSYPECAILIKHQKIKYLHLLTVVEYATFIKFDSFKTWIKLYNRNISSSCATYVDNNCTYRGRVDEGKDCY
jgi:hypothetical protein